MTNSSDGVIFRSSFAVQQAQSGWLGEVREVLRLEGVTKASAGTGQRDEVVRHLGQFGLHGIVGRIRELEGLVARDHHVVGPTVAESPDDLGARLTLAINHRLTGNEAMVEADVDFLGAGVYRARGGWIEAGVERVQSHCRSRPG